MRKIIYKIFDFILFIKDSFVHSISDEELIKLVIETTYSDVELESVIKRYYKHGIINSIKVSLLIELSSNDDMLGKQLKREFTPLTTLPEDKLIFSSNGNYVLNKDNQVKL